MNIIERLQHVAGLIACKVVVFAAPKIKGSKLHRYVFYGIIVSEKPLTGKFSKLQFCEDASSSAQNLFYTLEGMSKRDAKLQGVSADQGLTSMQEM